MPLTQRPLNHPGNKYGTTMKRCPIFSPRCFVAPRNVRIIGRNPFRADAKYLRHDAVELPWRVFSGEPLAG